MKFLYFFFLGYVLCLRFADYFADNRFKASFTRISSQKLGIAAFQVVGNGNGCIGSSNFSVI